MNNLKNRDTISIVNKYKISEIVKSIKLTSKNVEIGPGRGNITLGIVSKLGGKKLILIEINSKLSKLLRKKLTRRGVKVLNKDILKVNIGELGRITIIGNIPYSISNRILTKLLLSRRNINTQYLMIQIDIFSKLTTIGNWRYYLYNVVYKIHCVCRLKGNDFDPKVKVSSAFIKMSRQRIINNITEAFIINNCRKLSKLLLKTINIGLPIYISYKNIRLEEYIYIMLIFRRKIE
ncbi:hypothetical protein JSR06_00075 [Candidatus Vidania fulgoroideae]|uniref:Ribosomal RNA adenine methylase transferase N-terminal domain-containing protein n=1 Tax=Candidatus Vidania fulgoroideorum TaxID=881286 RepID=A0A975AER9_9PROT|nr:hypothetical protein JSR06_00075 [Candidatus Vidania fulgoroideae]